MSIVTGPSTSDVLAYTGVDLSDGSSVSFIPQAQAVIETYVGAVVNNWSAFNASDRDWLFRAICYQAAWLSSQPGLFGRTDFTSQSQDGLSLSTRDESTLVLAPLARKALRRLSWVRSRTVRVGTGPQTAVASQLTNAGQAPAVAYPAGTPVIDSPDDNWFVTVTAA